MTARPLTRAELDLHALDWQARRLFGLGVATVEACGVERPACVALRRTVTRELLRLSVALGATEERIKTMNQAQRDTHRGHRIDVINAGPRGWVAYVDMHEIGRGVSRQDVEDVARRWIDEAIWEQYMRRERTAELIAATRPPAREFRGLRLVHDADRDERMEAGIGRPADEFGSW